jgi:Domain of unknown function (DUF5664)
MVEASLMEGELVVSSSGATSTKLEEAWHLIPFAAVAAMARRFWLGSQKHAPRNWEKAIEAKDSNFAELRLAHLYRHVALFAEYRRQEDLDAIMCNGAMLCHFKEHGLLPERPVIQSDGCTDAACVTTATP